VYGHEIVVARFRARVLRGGELAGELGYAGYGSDVGEFAGGGDVAPVGRGVSCGELRVVGLAA
jgi:hypothetical protein